MGYLIALIATACGGSTIPIGKLVAGETPPINFVFHFLLYGSILTLFLLPFAKGAKVKINKVSIVPIIGHVAGIFFALLSLWTGIVYLNPAVAAFLLRVENLITIMLAIIFLRERLSAMLAVAAAITISGIIIMKAPSTFSDSQNIGFLLIMASAGSFAVAELFSKYSVRYFHPIHFVNIRNIILTILFGIVGYIKGDLVFLTGRLFWITFLVALLGPFAARTLFIFALQRIELSKAAIITQTNPIFASLLAIILIDDMPAIHEWIGGFVIIMGCVLLVTSRKKH